MTPEQIAKPNTEAAHQMALFAWAAVAQLRGFQIAWEWARTGGLPDPSLEELFPQGDKGVKELKWLHHIPNGGSRGDTERSRAIEGGKLKAQGVKPGVPDVFLPVARHGCMGLYIEMKKPMQQAARNGGLSEAQIEFGMFARAQGYGWMPAYGWQEAAQAIERYLS